MKSYIVNSYWPSENILKLTNGGSIKVHVEQVWMFDGAYRKLEDYVANEEK